MMRISPAMLWVLVALPAVAQTGQASPPAPITMAQAVDRALTGNPTLVAARAHVTATRATAVTAGLRQNPTLTVTGQGVTLPEVNNDGGNPYYYSANVSRLFERGEKRRWRLDVAVATGDQTEDQLFDTQRTVTLNVRTAFTNLLAAKGQLASAQENLDDYRRTLELSKARLDAGDITGTDFERVDLQLAQFESDFDNATLNLRQTSAQLETLFGVERPTGQVDATGSLDVPPLTETLPELEQDALIRRPDLRAAEQGLRAAEAGARLAQAGGTADPTVSSEYERSGAANTFGFTVAVPLRIFDRNQGEKARTRYEVNSSRATLQATHNQAISDVDQAWNALGTARLLAGRYHSHYLAEAERVRDNIQFSYRNGNTTLLDYLSALRDFRATRLAAVQADAQVWLAIHQLSFATGTDVTP